VTGKVFFEFKYKVMADKNIEREYNNIIYGIGSSKNEDAYMEDYKKDSEIKLKKMNE